MGVISAYFQAVRHVVLSSDILKMIWCSHQAPCHDGRHQLVGVTQEADCSVVPVVVPWPFLVKHYKPATHELQRDTFVVPH